MMEHICNYLISANVENLRQELFVLPDGSDSLHVHVDMPPKCRCMGFIILKDPRGQIRFQKLLGYGELSISLGKTGKDTSQGGVPGKIQAGDWTLILGMFTEYVMQQMGQRESLLSITITNQKQSVIDPVGEWVWTEESLLYLSDEKYGWNTIYNSNPGWYKGDFHTHTTLSDGKETRASAMEKAVQMELDFYVPTEHNLLHTGWCTNQMCILPGIEITTEKGHFNLFGVNRIPKRLLDIVSCNGEDIVEQYVDETIKEAREEGWIVSINHPFLTIWSWRCPDINLDEIDCIEIINDPTYTDGPKSNDKAISFLDLLWEDGHKVYGVGGSDSHNLIEERYEGAELPSIVGDPGTYVHCTKLTPAKLMSQVKKGHMYITRFCRLEIDITVNGLSYLPGDELLFETKEAQMTYSIGVRDLEEEPIITFIKNGEKSELLVLSIRENIYEAHIQLPISHEEWTWMRAEVRKKTGEFLGYVNPVYCGSKSSTCRTFGQIETRMEC